MLPYLNSLQHGFRQNRSCVNQMIQYVHFLASTLDSGGQLDTILYLDMAEAFERVSHQKLLFKLRYLGFRDPLLSWIEDYLTIRRHRVIIEGVASQWKPVTSGVPQGSIIESILFLIISTDSFLHLFADDAKLCRAITTHIDCSIFQVDISSVNTWCETWDMTFNPIKCKHLRITKKRNPVCATYHLVPNVLILSKKQKDLGSINLTIYPSEITSCSKSTLLTRCYRNDSKNLWQTSFIRCLYA